MAKKKLTSNQTLTVIRGGKRDGAGRPYGSGKYGEPTKAIRVPQSLIQPIQQYLSRYGHEKAVPSKVFPFMLKAGVFPQSQRAPLFDSKVAAGFPSPAEAHMDSELDLNEYITRNPASTFYVRVEGNSMLGAGIHPNDLLVVDLSLEPRDGNIVIAFINGEFTVKRLKLSKNKQVSLLPENENYPVLTIKEGMDFRIWGVVTNVIHALI
jgi:DNA polymerase V